MKFRLGVFCLIGLLPFLINSQKAQEPRNAHETLAMGAKPQTLASSPSAEGNPVPPPEQGFLPPEKTPVPAASAEKETPPEPAPAAGNERGPASSEKEDLLLPPAKSPLPEPAEKDTVPPAGEKGALSPPPVEKDTAPLPKQDSPLPPAGADTGQKKRLGYHHYSYESSFGGSGMGRGSFDHPVAIAVDSQDNIYVVDQGRNNLIQKFSKDGEFICQWGKRGTKSGEFDSLSAIAIDKNDNIYVVDTGNNRIQKFNPAKFNSWKDPVNDPNYSFFFKVIGSLGSGESKFQTPTDIVIDDDNALYVVDSGNSRIQKFDNEGEFEKEFGSYGSCRECFLAPSRIAYDPTGFGYLYVLDQTRRGFVLHQIDTSGRFLRTLDVFHQKEFPISKPTRIYFDSDGFLYVVDQEKGSVYKFNTNGEFIQKIGDPSSTSREAALDTPQAIVQDSDKRLLIVDSKDNRIKIFDQI